MTAPKPEAPTLDEQIELMQKCVEYWQSDPRWSHILASLNRLRAIENAKGMPPVPGVCVFAASLTGYWTTERIQILIDNNKDLRLHAQHLQDRLNRMEEALRDDAYAISFQSMKQYRAALLAKVEGREK